MSWLSRLLRPVEREAKATWQDLRKRARGLDIPDVDALLQGLAEDRLRDWEALAPEVARVLISLLTSRGGQSLQSLADLLGRGEWIVRTSTRGVHDRVIHHEGDE